MLLTFFIITLICFILIKLLPLIVIDGNTELGAIILKRREALGYNKPILEQFFRFWYSIFAYPERIFGESQGFANRELIPYFLDKLPATMLINVYSLVLSIPLGIGLGIFAALKKNKWQDHIISTGVMIFISVPSFVFAFLIFYLFYFKLGWLPAQMNPGYDYFSWSMFKSILMPVLALSFGIIAGFTRTTRAELTEVLTSDFMLLARTKGLTKAQATIRHGLKNCMVVILPAIFGEFISILSGSLIIESIFGVPGIGAMFLESIGALDYNAFMLLTIFYTFIGLAAGIIIDISYGIIDPRIRMGER